MALESPIPFIKKEAFLRQTSIGTITTIAARKGIGEKEHTKGKKEDTKGGQED